MLDLKTLLAITFFISVLQGATWIFVWRAWRKLYELKFLAAGFIAVAIGVLLIMLRGPHPPGWYIVIGNMSTKLGLVLMAGGLARFLGQPSYPWLGASMIIVQIVLLTGAMIIAPDVLSMRIHASTFFTIVMMGSTCLTLLRDRTQPRLLRWITIGVLLEYVSASIVQSLLTSRNSASSVLDNSNAWYFFQADLFLISFFACMLFMVSSRLSADLVAKNDALSREVAERRRLELQLGASLEAEQALREEQQQFVRMLSHELRTPLAIIQRSAEMIGVVQHQPPEAVTQRLTGIQEAVQRLVKLIDRFLVSDRQESSPFQTERIDVDSLLADVARHFHAMGQGTRLRFQRETALPDYRGDPDMLLTVLINLVDNALKYSPEDKPVDIVARADMDALILAVQDNGIGIPQEESSMIGRRFFRASNTAAATGTGLGLYNARKLLAYHDGMLELLPADGGGVIAAVRLPLPGVFDESSQRKLSA
jgi:signal transduction histidine kinase